MAVTKNTADLLAQAAANLPDNTTQEVSPQDVREMDENIAQSSYNKISDSALVGLKQHSTIPTYESGQGTVNGGVVYISNKITGPGAFVPADWDAYGGLSPADQAKIDNISITQPVDLDQLETDTATNNSKISATTANVDSAGAVMETDTSTATMAFVIDEDNMISDSETKVPTQQSVKAYVDNTVSSAKAYKGAYDANANNPDLDSTPIAGILSGYVYDVTVAGSFFGSVDLEIGDTITAKQDSPTTAAHWVVTQANLTPASIKTQYESNSDTNAYTDADQTKVGHISVTQAVDLDTLESDTAANNSKVSNVTTDLTEGTATNTTVDVNSSDGTNATLSAASTSRAGVMTKAKFDEVVANNAKVTFPEAPNDGTQYARKDLGWEAITGGGNLGDTNLTQNADTVRTYNIDGKEIRFIDGASSKLKVLPSGVGVGSVSIPVSQLEVKGDASVGTGKVFRSENLSAASFFEFLNSGQANLSGKLRVNGSVANSFELHNTSAVNNKVHFRRVDDAGDRVTMGLDAVENFRVDTNNASITLKSLGLIIEGLTNSGSSSLISVENLAGTTFFDIKGDGDTTLTGKVEIVNTTADNLVLKNSTAVNNKLVFFRADGAGFRAKIGLDAVENFEVITNNASFNVNVLGVNVSGLNNSASTSLLSLNNLAAQNVLDVRANNRIGMYGAAAVPRATTSITAPSPVSTAGTALTDTDTFEGYTLSQVVKALRDIGILT